FTVESGNATGTTFTVNSKATAFQIRGGAGSDTVDATGLTFTSLERDFIFNAGSIETIIDDGGLFTAPAPGPDDL
ncbi:hypothetical protein, partial [Ruegeria sp. SCP11]|uniref:hypothetical protein n=1 Tax=Ruegeria sp. SCP11 TaxID=3141378 RepID=UPI00333A5A87